MENHIGIDFTIEEGTLRYTDCLWLPVDHNYTEVEIEQMKRNRFEAWVNFVTSPPAPPPETEESLPNTVRTVEE